MNTEEIAEVFKYPGTYLDRDGALGRNAYNMVINKFGDRLYNGLVETETAHLRTIAIKVEESQGEGFLRELKLRWENHNKSMQMVRDILMVTPCSLSCGHKICRM